MFQGMASGHPSLSTVHAGSVDDLMKRLQTHPINLSPGLMESLNIVIVMAHAREKGKSARRIKEIDEIESIDADTGVPRIVKSFVWTPSDDVYEYRGSSWILSKISREKGMGFNNILKDISRRKKLIDWLFENNVTDLSTVTNYIRLYRINPEKIEDIIAGKDQFRDKYLETASENKIKGLK
jgi:flagellar protein FlaI